MKSLWLSNGSVLKKCKKRFRMCVALKFKNYQQGFNDEGFDD